jgi:hypothetical protein
MSDSTWTTKDGKEILITEMTTNHIINALDLMERKKKNLEAELNKRVGCDIDALFEKVKNERLKELKKDMHP